MRFIQDDGTAFNTYAMYIYIFEFIHAYSHLFSECMCIWVCLYVFGYVCMYLGMFVFIYECMYVCMHGCRKNCCLNEHKYIIHETTQICGKRRVSLTFQKMVISVESFFSTICQRESEHIGCISSLSSKKRNR